VQSRDLLDEIDLARQIGPIRRHGDAQPARALVDDIEPDRRQNARLPIARQ
jgi:hypothetical protein